MGGGVPIVDDVLDFGGDVIETAGDFVDDAIDVVTENPELALIALPFMGPEMFALDAAAAEGLGGVGAFDVASSAIPGLTFDAATGEYLLADAGLGGLGLGTQAGGTLFTDIVNADTFDPTSFLPGNNPYDPVKQYSDYAKYAKDAYNIYNMLNPESQSQIKNQFQQQNLYDPSSGDFDYANVLAPFLNYGQQAYNRYNLLSNYGALDPVNFDPIDVLGNLSMKGLQELTTLPGAVSTGLGVLSIYDQMRVNNLIQKGYDENKAKQLVYEQKYTTPEGIASLPKQNITGLAPRAVSDVVVKPKAAKGGSINDLYNEYSQLNNRMRNYRRLAKGGVI